MRDTIAGPFSRLISEQNGQNTTQKMAFSSTGKQQLEQNQFDKTESINLHQQYFNETNNIRQFDLNKTSSKNTNNEFQSF